MKEENSSKTSAFDRLASALPLLFVICIATFVLIVMPTNRYEWMRSMYGVTELPIDGDSHVAVIIFAMLILALCGFFLVYFRKSFLTLAIGLVPTTYALYRLVDGIAEAYRV